MKVLLCRPRGFCAGVERAIETVERALAKFGRPVYVRHEIVHNKVVVQDLVQKGAVFVDHLEDVPTGSHVIFSAHGVAPDVFAQATRFNLNSIDATCPLVTKVHVEAKRFDRQGMTILLIGHEDHVEVEGVVGEAPQRTIVVATAEEAEQVQVPDPEKVAVLTQTTLSVDEAMRVMTVLKRRFPNLHTPRKEDICYATTNRQTAVRAIAPEADFVLVVGSKNSSNSVRLTEISQNDGTPSRLVDDASELDPAWFEGANTVLVTSGASVPEDLVHGVIEALITRFGGEVEQRDVHDERVEFGLPSTLKDLMRKRGIDPETRRIRIDREADTTAWLERKHIPNRTVQVTLRASESGH
jgi:4-hydroxy-3-methylbut-2-enyl diphosphate reductase